MLLRGEMDGFMEHRGLRGLKVKPAKATKPPAGGRRSKQDTGDSDSDGSHPSPQQHARRTRLAKGRSDRSHDVAGASKLASAARKPSSPESAHMVAEAVTSASPGVHSSAGTTSSPQNAAAAIPGATDRPESGRTHGSKRSGGAARSRPPSSEASDASDAVGSEIESDVDDSDDDGEDGERDVVGEDWLAHDADEVRKEYADAKLLQEKDLDNQFQRTNALKGLKLKPTGPPAAKRAGGRRRSGTQKRKGSSAAGAGSSGRSGAGSSGAGMGSKNRSGSTAADSHGRIAASVAGSEAHGVATSTVGEIETDSGTDLDADSDNSEKGDGEW